MNIYAKQKFPPFLAYRRRRRRMFITAGGVPTARNLRQWG